MGTTILIASGKGGAGKTTFAVNLGICYARSGLRTLIMDMNMGLRNDDIYLGLEDRILFDLSDALSGVCRIEKALVQHDSCPNLYLLSCPQYREIAGLSPEYFKALCESLGAVFDIILIDCPVCSGRTMEIYAAGADKALLLVTPDQASLRNTQSVNILLSQFGLESRSYVINNIDPQTAHEPSLPAILDITRAMDIPLIGMMASDLAIHTANNSGLPVCLQEESAFSRNFEDIASRLTL